MQEYIDSLIRSFPGSTFSRDCGVVRSTVSAGDIDGEDNHNGILFNSSLWAVSLWAMATNGIQAVSTKIRKRSSKSLSEILWEMGRSPDHVSSTFCDRFSSFNHKAKHGAAGWKSLDLFYNYHEKVLPGLNGGFESFITRYWIGNMESRQAVSNRLKIVIRLLALAFQRCSHLPEVRLLSIASGSAQAVIGAMKNCPQINIKAVLLDNDPTALEEAEKEFARAGLKERVKLVKGTPRHLEEICQHFKPHIIEMVGFLDYRPTRKAIELISRIRKNLSDEGMFITGNIKKNREKIFLDWLLLWPMIYRDQEEFIDLLLRAGFSREDITQIYEPLEIHGLAVCKKEREPFFSRQPASSMQIQDRDREEDEYSALPGPGSLLLQALAEDIRKTVLAPAAFTASVGKSIEKAFRGFSDWLQNCLLRKTVYDLEYQYEIRLEEPYEK